MSLLTQYRPSNSELSSLAVKLMPSLHPAKNIKEVSAIKAFQKVDAVGKSVLAEIVF
jgi:hypothetical protein